MILRIPISRPTGDIRAEILKSIAGFAEQARIQLRGARTDAMKAAKEMGDGSLVANVSAIFVSSVAFLRPVC